MQQKDEKDYVEVLSRIRLGYVTGKDIAFLEKQKISLVSNTVSGRMKEVVQILNTLLPTRHMCNELNKEVLEGLPGNEIWLLAIDTVDSPTYLH